MRIDLRTLENETSLPVTSRSSVVERKTLTRTANDAVAPGGKVTLRAMVHPDAPQVQGPVPPTWTASVRRAPEEGIESRSIARRGLPVPRVWLPALRRVTV